MTGTPLAPTDGGVTPRIVLEQHGRMFDSATGLPTWPLLIDRVHVALQRAARHDLVAAVVVLDDVRRSSPTSPGFSTFVSLLHNAVYVDDTIARIGGRTFVVVLNDVSNRDQVATTTGEIVEGFGITCRVGMSFGAAPRDPQDLIEEAIRGCAAPASAPPPLSSFEEYGRKLAEFARP
jgi:GGDEF domain-containing protein